MPTNFAQPPTIRVYEHNVAPVGGWPAPVHELVSALSLQTDLNAFPEHLKNTRQRNILSAMPPADDRLLQTLAILSTRVSSDLALLERLGQAPETVPKDMYLFPFVTNVLIKIWPDQQLNLNAPFALPVDPCCFNDPNARFCPPYMRAQTILTAPIPICPSARPATSSASERHGETSSRASNIDEADPRRASGEFDNGGAGSRIDEDEDWKMVDVDGESVHEKAEEAFDEQAAHGDADTAMTAAGIDRSEDFSFGIIHSRESSSYYAQSCEDEPEVTDSLCPHAHVLLRTRQGVIDFPLLCVGSPSTIYYIMSSCLLHRRALGIEAPMVGIVLDTYATHMRLVLGWTCPSSDRSCSDIHIASASHGTPDRALGLFDLRDSFQATVFGWCLAGLRPHATEVMKRATEKCSMYHGTSDILQWRLDLAGRDERIDVSERSNQISTWLEAAACSSESETLLSSPSLAGMDKIAAIQKSAKGSSRHTATSSTVSSRASATIPTREWKGTRLVFTDPDVQALLDDPKSKAGILPLLYAGNGRSMSASEFAAATKQVQLGDLSPAEVMFLDRLNVMVPYPRLEEEVEKQEALRIIFQHLWYFDPVSVPEVRPALVKHANIYEFYRQHTSAEEKLRSLSQAGYTRREDGSTPKVEERPSRSTQSSDSVKEDFLAWFDYVVDQSVNAASHDWSSGLEIEGRLSGWDAIHIPMLSGPSVEANTFVRLEHPVRIPANTVAYHSDTDGFFGSFSTHALGLINSLVPKFFTLARTRASALELLASGDPELRSLAEELRTAEREYPTFFRTAAGTQTRSIATWSGLIPDSLDAILSRVLEEPDKAKCDVVAGIRIHDVFEADSKASVALADEFNVVVESRVLATSIQPLRTLNTFFHDLRSKAQTNAANPFGRLGTPDIKDLAELLTDMKIPAAHSSSLEADTTLRSTDKSFLGEELSFASHFAEGPSFDRSEEVIEQLQSLVLSFYQAEHKRQQDEEHSSQSVHQACMYLNAAVAQLAAANIYNFPVFCTVTDGPIGAVFSAWGAKFEEENQSLESRPSVVVYVAMHNPPTFDIRNPIHALRFASFLLHLRHVHAPRLVRLFNEKREEFRRRWQTNDPSLRWTLAHQRTDFKEKLEDLHRRQEEARQLVAEQKAKTESRKDGASALKKPGSSTSRGASPHSRPSSRDSRIPRSNRSGRT